MREVIYVAEQLRAGTGGQGKQIRNRWGEGGGPEKGGTGRRGYGRGVHGLKRGGGQKVIHGAEQEARENMKIIRHPGAATEASRWQKFFAVELDEKLDFLHGFLKFGQWNLILPCNCVFAGENCDQPLIADTDVATAYGGVEKTMPYLTNRHQAQSLSALVHSLVASCNPCQRAKQSNKAPLDLVTQLHVPVRPCTDISMDFCKLTTLLINCSTMYPNHEVDYDQILCISRICTIVDRDCGY